MKALFLRTDFYGSINVGGSFSHVKGFLDGLQQLGHEFAAIASGNLSVSGGTVYTIPYSSLFRNLPEVLSIAYNFTLLREARKIIRKEKPDFIYHRHSEFNYSSAMLADEFAIPLVLECNGSEVWVKKNWGRIYLEKILQMAENVQFNRADIITVVSNVMKEDLARLGIDKKKIIVNPNGVDPAAFSPRIDGVEITERYKLGGKIVAGFVGTFGAWHGVEVLARSIKPTVQKNPHVHFLIIGDGVLRGDVERIIREDKVENFATLTGAIPHATIPRYLAACDILLSPHVQNSDGTLFFGSPTKLFEYMGMGKPVIASGVGQIGEVIHDGVNGMLIEHKNHMDLAEKILLLAENPKLRKSLGDAARQDAVERFSWQKNAERVITAVEPLVQR
ncbi:MAG: glycosyltransferase family 4 protein [Bacteroidota bacterium]|nr:glycosyltransferase family 4 protein [Bacteroidota bacterium]